MTREEEAAEDDALAELRRVLQGGIRSVSEFNAAVSNIAVDKDDFTRQTAVAFAEDPTAVAYSLGHSDAKRRKIEYSVTEKTELERMLPDFATLGVEDLRRCFAFLHPEHQAPSGQLARNVDWLRTQVGYMKEHHGQVLTQRSDRSAWERHKNAEYKLYLSGSV